MLVHELIERLEDMDLDALVVMTADGEGNNHSPLDYLWEGGYRAETTYSGEVGLWRLTDDHVIKGYTEEDVIKDQKAVILCPTN